MIRVLLADDHALLRDALTSILQAEADIEVIGEADSGEAALRLCRELQPDVVLMDIAFADISGIEVTATLAAENSPVKVLAVSSHLESSFVTRMLTAGASGYIHKAVGRDHVLQGIRTVAAGAPYLSPNVALLLAHNHDQKEPGEAKVNLSKRETMVLRLVAEGKTSAQIAEQLFIALGTVEVHRHNIMRKLGLHSVVDLTRYAIRERLVIV